MKKFTIIITTTIVILIIILMGDRSQNGDLVNPLNKILPSQSTPFPTPVSTPVPPQAPKTFQFDSSTDLEAELEKVNPQVLESDFD